MEGATLGPLHGVPFSVKDLLNTAGVRTTFGNFALEYNVPAKDSGAVARLKRAGAIAGKAQGDLKGVRIHWRLFLGNDVLDPETERLFKSAVAVFADFELHGPAAIAAMREADPGGYVRMIALLCPREVALESPLDMVSDSELADMIMVLQALVAERSG
ncbi:MAG: hypothetical protein EXQ87_13395 [Alphaproteobacteria bacterium]|nr:hypothetical protein [Alphaproteobacteria bacterium]